MPDYAVKANIKRNFFMFNRNLNFAVVFIVATDIFNCTRYVVFGER